jgi:transcriptional regulator with XRE-family HTH domain
MMKFGETVRKLRMAQNKGLRETAGLINISPAYLSRIERGKESPPKPEIIKKMALVLAADPDVLFRLASTTDPAITDYINEKPELLELIRLVVNYNLSSKQIGVIIEAVKNSRNETNLMKLEIYN